MARLAHMVWTGGQEALAREAERARKPVVVVLNNAPFHKAGAVRDEREGFYSGSS